MEDATLFKYSTIGDGFREETQTKLSRDFNLNAFVDRFGNLSQAINIKEDASLKQLKKRLEKQDRARNRVIAAWGVARGHLRDAARDFDVALRPYDLTLSLADDSVPDDMAGAVELRFHRLGGGWPQSLLDIQVDLEGRHHVHAFGRDSHKAMPPPPPIEHVTIEDYQVLVMTFLEGEMRALKPRKAARCSQCKQPALMPNRCSEVGPAWGDR